MTAADSWVLTGQFLSRAPAENARLGRLSSLLLSCLRPLVRRKRRDLKPERSELALADNEADAAHVGRRERRRLRQRPAAKAGAKSGQRHAHIDPATGRCIKGHAVLRRGGPAG